MVLEYVHVYHVGCWWRVFFGLFFWSLQSRCGSRPSSYGPHGHAQLGPQTPANPRCWWRVFPLPFASESRSPLRANTSTMLSGRPAPKFKKKDDGNAQSRLDLVLYTAFALAIVLGIIWIGRNHPLIALLAVCCAVLLAASMAAVAIMLHPPFRKGLRPGVWRRRARRPPAAEKDLPRRRKVWQSLSELYLDTRLDRRGLVQIAVVLADTGYSVPQLEEILYRELHPVLLPNVLQEAGDFAGFDAEWLEQQILKDRRTRACFFCFCCCCCANCFIVPGKFVVQDNWASLERLLTQR
jgi:hypothetical protein